MKHINKKGLAPQTLGELIIVIAGGIIVLFLVFTMLSFISPTIGGFGCGLNLRIDAAILDHTRFLGKPLMGAPIFMCNQYKTPVDINAANFNACPDIAGFCNEQNFKNNPTLKEDCWKQCARIQIDQLTDSCWTMAGSGKLNFEDTWLKNIGNALGNPILLGATILTGGAAWVLLGPFMGGLIVGGELVGYAILPPQGAKVLRCYRFRIVNPIMSPITPIPPKTRQPIDYFDSSMGHSWVYSLNCSCANCSSRTICPSLMDPHICLPSADDPMCSFGGVGVSYINDLGEVRYKIGDKEIGVPNTLQALYAGSQQNYNIPDPRNQVCYIAYYQGNTLAALDVDKNKAFTIGTDILLTNKYVIRSCKSWYEYISQPNPLN